MNTFPIRPSFPDNNRYSQAGAKGQHGLSQYACEKDKPHKKQLHDVQCVKADSWEGSAAVSDARQKMSSLHLFSQLVGEKQGSDDYQGTSASSVLQSEIPDISTVTTQALLSVQNLAHEVFVQGYPRIAGKWQEQIDMEYSLPLRTAPAVQQLTQLLNLHNAEISRDLEKAVWYLIHVHIPNHLKVLQEQGCDKGLIKERKKDLLTLKDSLLVPSPDSEGGFDFVGLQAALQDVNFLDALMDIVDHLHHYHSRRGDANEQALMGRLQTFLKALYEYQVDEKTYVSNDDIAKISHFLGLLPSDQCKDIYSSFPYSPKKALLLLTPNKLLEQVYPMILCHLYTQRLALPLQFEGANGRDDVDLGIDTRFFQDGGPVLSVDFHAPDSPMADLNTHHLEKKEIKANRKSHPTPVIHLFIKHGVDHLLLYIFEVIKQLPQYNTYDQYASLLAPCMDVYFQQNVKTKHLHQYLTTTIVNLVEEARREQRGH